MCQLFYTLGEWQRNFHLLMLEVTIMWIELGIFVLVLVFAAWQLHDLRQEKRKRQDKAAGPPVDRPGT